VEPAELTAALGEPAEAAVSLREALGRDIDRNVFAAALLSRLEKWHHTFATRGPDAVRVAWQARDALRGRRLEARSGNAICEGWCRGIDVDGSLVLEDDAGQARRIVSGAVRVIDVHPQGDD
jgi:biotin-(acetyl-CoA carboxylase) ligase